MAPVVLIQDLKDFPENKIVFHICYRYFRFEGFYPTNEDSLKLINTLTVFSHVNYKL